MAELQFELVSPERLLASETASMVVIPGAEGDFGVLPEHAPLISTMRPGVIAIYQGDSVERQIFVEGGFAEVNASGCIILAEAAEPLDEITAEKARERMQIAEEDLAEATNASEQELGRLEKALDIARVRVDVLGSN